MDWKEDLAVLGQAGSVYTQSILLQYPLNISSLLTVLTVFLEFFFKDCNLYSTSAVHHPCHYFYVCDTYLGSNIGILPCTFTSTPQITSRKIQFLYLVSFLQGNKYVLLNALQKLHWIILKILIFRNHKPKNKTQSNIAIFVTCFCIGKVIMVQ